MHAKGKNEGSVQNVSSVAEIEALPTTTDAILVSRLDDSKAKALGRLRHLRVLYQDGSPTGLTDVGVEALAQLPFLEVLDLEWADEITDHGLATLHHVQRLRWIDIGGCSGLSENAVQELRRAKPALAIDGIAAV